MDEMQCSEFDDLVEELAIGDLAEPLRSRALAHAASCHACRQQLDSLLAVTDTLLLLAPQHEPPPGFESRVLERIGGASSASALPLAMTVVDAAPASNSSNASASSRSRRRVRRWWIEAVAAVALVAASAGAVAIVDDGDGNQPTTVRSGVIRNASGAVTGDIRLVDAKHPYALVTLDYPRYRAGEVACELELADGTLVDIGSWGYSDVAGNVWAVGIDTDLLDAVAMRVVADDGSVVATAALGS